MKINNNPTLIFQVNKIVTKKIQDVKEAAYSLLGKIYQI